MSDEKTTEGNPTPQPSLPPQVVETLSKQTAALAARDDEIAKYRQALDEQGDTLAKQIDELDEKSATIERLEEDLKLAEARVVEAQRERTQAVDLYEKSQRTLAGVRGDRNTLKAHLENTKAELAMLRQKKGGGLRVKMDALAKAVLPTTGGQSPRRVTTKDGEPVRPRQFRPAPAPKSPLTRTLPQPDKVPT